MARLEEIEDSAVLCISCNRVIANPYKKSFCSVICYLVETDDVY